MNAVIRKALREIVLRTPFGKYLGYRHQYMFTPAQLGFLVRCVDETSTLPGPIIEVGCAAGITTVWLNKHLDTLSIEKQYVAIDTFSGFLQRDIQYEVSRRGKSGRQAVLDTVFAENRKRWVETTLRRNGVHRVTLVEADAATFDYSSYRQISFALVDVDLYLPVKGVLQRIYPYMARGGIIVVDDCAGPGLWDGALQAYLEFVAEKQVQPEILLAKLGVIRV